VAQGTIKEYDDRTRSGSLLTDDRREIAIDARSFGDPEIRTLRLGQRVRFELEGEGDQPVARDLRLVTFE